MSGEEAPALKCCKQWRWAWREERRPEAILGAIHLEIQESLEMDLEL